jgi:hypothetical protein
LVSNHGSNLIKIDDIQVTADPLLMIDAAPAPSYSRGWRLITITHDMPARLLALYTISPKLSPISATEASRLAALASPFARWNDPPHDGPYFAPADFPAHRESRAPRGNRR